MDYLELKKLKDLLSRYVNNEKSLDKNDILFKINEDVLDNLAIIVSRHLDDGKQLEDIIKQELEDRVLFEIKDIVKYNQKNGSYINPRDLEKRIKQVIKKF